MKFTFLYIATLSLFVISCKEELIVPDDKLQKIIGEYGANVTRGEGSCDAPGFNDDLGGGEIIVNTTENPLILSVHFDEDFPIKIPNLNLKITRVEGGYIYFEFENNKNFTDDCFKGEQFFNIDGSHYVSPCCNVDLIFKLENLTPDSRYLLRIFGKHGY